MIQASRTGNPFEHSGLLIARMDQLARNEDLPGPLPSLSDGGLLLVPCYEFQYHGQIVVLAFRESGTISDAPKGGFSSGHYASSLTATPGAYCACSTSGIILKMKKRRRK